MVGSKGRLVYHVPIHQPRMPIPIDKEQSTPYKVYHTRHLNIEYCKRFMYARCLYLGTCKTFNVVDGHIGVVLFGGSVYYNIHGVYVRSYTTPYHSTLAI